MYNCILMVSGALKDKSGPLKDEGGAGIVQLLTTLGFRLILSQGFTSKLDTQQTWGQREK